MLKWRSHYPTKQHHISRLLKHIQKPNALAIPDFTLGAAPELHKSQIEIPRYIGPKNAQAHTHDDVNQSADEDEDSDDGDIDENDYITYETIHIATRPQLAQPIYEKIIHQARTSGYGKKYQRFRKLNHIRNNPRVAPELSKFLQFDDSAKGGSALHSSATLANDALDNIDPVIILGPRHVGKSHLMLEIAARMITDPGVVVIYIVDCAELRVNGNDNDCFRYSAFIEYLMCAFCNYEFIGELVQVWYGKTGMGTLHSKMRDATQFLMHSIRKHCRENDITPVVFLDHCEDILFARSTEVIISISDLTQRLGLTTVMSGSDSVVMDPDNLPQSLKCIVSGPFSHEDAMNMFVATHGSLPITDDELKQLFMAAEYFPLDMDRMLAQLENQSMLPRGSTPKERQRALSEVISQQDLSRRMRVAQMHRRFQNLSLITHARSLESADSIQRIGPRRNIIDSDDPNLVNIKREVQLTVFMIHHVIPLKTGARRDLQFIVPEIASTSAGFTVPQAIVSMLSESTSAMTMEISTSERSVCCHPPAACDIMYSMHFRGSVREQFSWMERKGNKLDVDELIRLRYYDMLLMESGRIHGECRNALDDTNWTNNIRFSPVRNCPEARECTTFSAAIDVISAYIEKHNSRPPQLLPRGEEPCSRQETVAFYFPRLGLKESWMDTNIRSSTHFHGSFSALVTRIDQFNPKSKGKWAGYTACHFEVMWLASDPISISTPEADREALKIEAKNDIRVAHELKRDSDRAPEFDDATIRQNLVDYDKDYGSENSWAAKAIKLFPDIKSNTEKSMPRDANINSVRMLTLAPMSRYVNLKDRREKLIEDNNRLEDYRKTMDIGIMKTFLDTMDSRDFLLV
ncbi:hypothetical protein H4R24_000529 [Coemansia sp. RSA 988]|nr:hypothetical protein H4R24_000529 [Coemansia sp. RSA 988]